LETKKQSLIETFLALNSRKGILNSGKLNLKEVTETLQQVHWQNGEQLSSLS